MNILRFAICKKLPELLGRTPLILYENAACHKAGRVTSHLTSYEWETLPHPPYSPNMSLQTLIYFLATVKEPLRGVRFENLDSLEAEVASQIRRINFSCNGNQKVSTQMGIRH